MSHIPVNHPLRNLYRVLAALTGAYVLVFGIVAFDKTQGTPAFSQSHLEWALGLRANLGFAVMSIIAGAIVIACTLIGRNVDRYVDIVGGIVFMLAGAGMMLLMSTNANFLGFSMANCVVSLVIGLILFSAGLYAKTERTPRAARQVSPSPAGASAKAAAR